MLTSRCHSSPWPGGSLLSIALPEPSSCPTCDRNSWKAMSNRAPANQAMSNCAIRQIPEVTRV